MYEAVADDEVQALYPVVEVDGISGPILFPQVPSEIEWRYSTERSEVLQRAIVGPNGGISIFLPYRREDGSEAACDVYARRITPPFGALGEFHRIYRVRPGVRVAAERVDA